MTKIDGRTRQAAAQQIDESLRRLQTDHFDLLQHHEIIRLEDPDRIFASGGAMEALLAAKQAGKLRFIGFTGHKDPLVHLRMLEIAAKHDFHFDAVQMPLNVMDAHFRSFAHQVLPVLVKEGIGVLGMKSMSSGIILKSKTVSPVECLHYAMNLPTSTVITGIDSMEVLEQDLEAVKTFRPLGANEIASLLARTATAAAEGRFEPFKTANVFDGTAHHPEWLGSVVAPRRSRLPGGTWRLPGAVILSERKSSPQRHSAKILRRAHNDRSPPSRSATEVNSLRRQGNAVVVATWIDGIARAGSVGVAESPRGQPRAGYKVLRIGLSARWHKPSPGIGRKASLVASRWRPGSRNAPRGDAGCGSNTDVPPIGPRIGGKIVRRGSQLA